MRKNLHHTIMLSILAGSLALGFVYAPPAFAEDVTIADGETYTAPDGTQDIYRLNAYNTIHGTNYGDEEGYHAILNFPDENTDIGTFTVIAGNGGYIWYETGGDGGSISLSAIGTAINKGVSITAGNGGYSELGDSTGGAGGDVTLTFTNVVNGNITAEAGMGGKIYSIDNSGNLTGGNGGNVTLTFKETVTGIINATGGKGGNIVEISASGGNLTGGDGGNATLTFKNVVADTITATGGNGGDVNITNYYGAENGGNGGDATLTFENVVANSITLTSGINGNNNNRATAFKGGSVNFTAESISGTQSTDNINITLNKNDGALNFHTNTLNIQNNTVTITANGSIGDGQSQDNHIDTLLLTGNGNFITNLSNNADITVGKLAINGGTVNNDNWKNIIEHDYKDPNANTIALGENGVTFDITSDKELSKNLTGSNPGNLTKTGTGTLKLTGNTYDYTGLTVVEKGTLDASDSALTASKGLTLLGDTIFKANSTQNWNRKQIAVYDNGSNQYATYQGNLTATNSNLYFIASGDNTNPLLSVTGSADISGSKYNIVFTGKTTFDEGQTLTLIEADGTIDASGLQQGNGIDGIDDIKIGSTITQSITDVTTVPEVASNGSKLIATLGSTLATDEASVLNASMLGGLAFNLQGADLIAREGMKAAVRSAQLDNNHAVFAALTRSSLDYGTVDVDGTNMLAGLAWRSTTGAGSLTYGVFAEHGDGSYDTYANINGTNLHGEGDTDYTGGGILARMDFNGSENGHGYLEASGRVGNADTDYTNSGLRDAYGRAASYSTDGTYYGAHIGAGYVQKLDEKSSIDWYGKLLWARLEGGSADLSTGEHLTFDDADSLRLRIGGRWNYAASDFVSYYAGLGYEYEFDGEASGFTNGLALGDEDLTGGSGVAELGISFKPSKNSPFSLELNLAGFTGEREGFRGGVEAVYTF